MQKLDYTVTREFATLHASPLFHHCVGAVDGMLLPIQSPASSDTPETASRFWCRKNFYALNVPYGRVGAFAAILRRSMRFVYVGVNAPGSVHDCAAWALGSLFSCGDPLQVDFSAG